PAERRRSRERLLPGHRSASPYPGADRTGTTAAANIRASPSTRIGSPTEIGSGRSPLAPAGPPAFRSGSRRRRCRPADGSAEEQLLLTSDQNKSPQAWSRDGKFLLYATLDPKTLRWVSE